MVPFSVCKADASYTSRRGQQLFVVSPTIVAKFVLALLQVVQGLA